MIIDYLKQTFNRDRLGAIANLALDRTLENASPFMTAAGLMAFLAHPTFYVIWTYLYPQPYENIGLRVLGSLLAFPFIFKNYWPEKYQRYLPLAFQVAVIYNIPFFFTYYLIMNDFNQVWLFSTVGAAFLLTMLVDWKTAIVLFALGAIFWLVYADPLTSDLATSAYVQYLVIFLFPLVIGAIFNLKLQRYRKMQLRFEKRLRSITNQNSRMMQEQNLLLSHFLSNTIVAKLRQLQKKFDLDTAIKLITRQEERFCAIMEADIRNFTKMFGNESEMVVAQLVSKCFTEITSIGQDLAVIKPVGDALFMYADDDAGRENTVNNILALAIFFANSIDDINRQLDKRGEPPLNFGIAVHAGKAIYGNLASDTLIDPTIIGLNVNKTARMEELTKVPEIQESVGLNAIIISEEIFEVTDKLINLNSVIELDLQKLNTQVRDFPGVERVYALPIAASRELLGKAVLQIDNQRAMKPDALSTLETNSYLGVPYFYDMQGFGPNTSWTMMIDVSEIPSRVIDRYAIKMLEDLDYKVNRADGQWLILSTADMPGEFDEEDVESRLKQIIDELDQSYQIESSSGSDI